MRSPTAALLWEIGRRNRGAVAVVLVATAVGRLLDYAEQPTDDPSSVNALLAMVSFLFLFGIFSLLAAERERRLASHTSRVSVPDRPPAVAERQRPRHRIRGLVMR